jgi:hypothetical protein
VRADELRSIFSLGGGIDWPGRGACVCICDGDALINDRSVSAKACNQAARQPPLLHGLACVIR